MKSTLIWFIFVGATLIIFGGTVDAWNRQFYNRYSRNLYRNNINNLNGGIGGGSGGLSVGGFGSANNNDLSLIGSASNTGNGNEIDDLNALFGSVNGIGVDGFVTNDVTGRGSFNDVGILNDAIGNGQQNEVYGIVEPLMEDTPCLDRPCSLNDECCPGGVCVNTYGGGKCIYVYGHKRDLCRHNADCELGMSCLKGAAGNLVCQSTPLHLFNGNGRNVEVKQFGDDCVSSSDCNVAKGMCCQLQRNHHRMLPKNKCTYFRDPFMCIDIMPTEDVDTRNSRILTSFSQRRI